MKGAPDFVKWPDAVSGVWKFELLKWLGQTFNIKTLIESGTCEASTPLALERFFDNIYTVELHPAMYQLSVERTAKFPHIHCYFGDSRQLLPVLVGRAATSPILFWLDAHPSDPEKSANAGNPLPEEIGHILRLCPDALVVVDDMMGIDQFIGLTAPTDLTGWKIEYRTGEIIMHQEGRYQVPAFET